MPSITAIIRKAAGKLVGGQGAAVAGAAGASAAAPPKPAQVAQQGKKEGGQKA
jgi:hypothetical protein